MLFQTRSSVSLILLKRVFPFSQSLPHSRHGFTLLETSVVLLIVALLVGAVFGILQSSLQVADSVKSESDRELRLQKFVELCENVFNRLPPDGVISIRPHKGFGSQQQMLEMAFALSPFDAATPGIVTFIAEEAQSGSLQVSVSFEEVSLNFAQKRQNKSSGYLQIPLLHGLHSIHWRVYDPQMKKWVDQWNERVAAADIIKSGQTTLVGLPASGQNLALNLNASPLSQLPDAVNPAAETQETQNSGTTLYPRPPMLELSISENGGEPRRWIFWIREPFASQ